MKIIKKVLVPFLIIFLTVLLLSIFRKTPSAKLWNGYSVFYIEKSVSFSFVNQVFQKFQIQDYISEENQKFPLNIQKNTPEYSLALSNLEENDYLTERNKYFYDKNYNYKIFYVPDNFSKNLTEAFSFIKDTTDFSCGIDSSSSFPIVLYLVLIAFFVFLILKSEQKILFALLSILPIFYCFMMPFYSCFSGICLFLLGIFISLKLWNRKGGLKKLSKIRFLQIIFIFSVLNSFLTGFLNGIFFILVLFSDFSIVYLYKMLESFTEKKYTFKPVKIRSAKMVSLVSKKSVLSIFVCSVVLFFILIFSIFSVNFNSFSSKNNLTLPANKGFPRLVNLDDFILWRWKTLTFPYVSLNSEQNPNQVEFSVYKDNPESIQEIVNVMTFDQEFKNSSLSSIDLLSYPSIESLLKIQGQKNSYGYASSISQNVSFFNIILITASLLLSVAFFLICYKKLK